MCIRDSYDGVRASIEDDLEDDPDHILISHNPVSYTHLDVYKRQKMCLSSGLCWNMRA